MSLNNVPPFVQVFVSYMQIYNEKIYDLLQDAALQVCEPGIHRGQLPCTVGA